MLRRFAFFLVFSLVLGNSFAQDEPYAPEIDPENFVAEITHPYFSFAPNTIYVYEGESEEGLEHIEVSMLTETREVMGITTTVVRDSVWLEGELIEDTFDWYAQDSDGNVWYFGEATAEYEDGEVLNHDGAWEAGADGALPGIIMLAEPEVGTVYRQEYYEGEAEDMAEIISLDEAITVEFDSFENVWQTRDWNPLEEGSDEYKYYAEGIGLILETHLEGEIASQLIDIIELDGTETSPETTPIISEEEVIEIGEDLLGDNDFEPSLAFEGGIWVYTLSAGDEALRLDAITGEVLED